VKEEVVEEHFSSSPKSFWSRGQRFTSAPAWSGVKKTWRPAGRREMNGAGRAWSTGADQRMCSSWHCSRIAVTCKEISFDC
jgi:hypothetical protein